MMNDMRRLSVIVPTYNSAHFLGAALESIAGQSYHPSEVIVVDDGSTDATREVVRSFFLETSLPGHYAYQSNQGPAAARNRGLELATGDWVAFLDADDIWVPEKTARQFEVLIEYPDASVAWGEAMAFAGEPPSNASLAEKILPPQPMYLLQSMLFRREALDRVGPFDPKLRIGEDTDWLLRALEQSISIVVHRDLVVYYRRHATNLTSDRGLTLRTLPALLRQSIHRRRGQGPQEASHPSSLLVLTSAAGHASTSQQE